MASLQLVAEMPPLAEDMDGVLRVGGTRVRLDSVIAAFNNGCIPEEVSFKYPSLLLKDVYAVITYYRAHREQTEAYLETRRNLAEEAERDIESHFPSTGVRERVIARRTP